MKFWRSDRFLKKQYLAFGKFFNLPYYKQWKHEKNVKKNRLDKKNGRKSSPTWAKNRKKELIDFYGEKCIECGTKENLTVDHIEPLWKIGRTANYFSNLQLLCRSCHDKKERMENKARHGKKLSPEK